MPLLYDEAHIGRNKNQEKVFTSHKLDIGIKKYWCKNICIKEQRNNGPLIFSTVGQLKVFLLLNYFLQIKLLNFWCWVLLVAPEQISEILLWNSKWSTIVGFDTCTYRCRISTLLLKPSQQSWRLCTYLISVSSISISESLNVVEDKPGKRNDHQDDEGDGHKHHRSPADILLQVTCPNGNNHGYCHIVLQEWCQLATFGLWDHDGDYLPSPCRVKERKLMV